MYRFLLVLFIPSVYSATVMANNTEGRIRRSFYDDYLGPVVDYVNEYVEETINPKINKFIKTVKPMFNQFVEETFNPILSYKDERVKTFPSCIYQETPPVVTGCLGLEFGKKYVKSYNGGLLTRCSGRCHSFEGATAEAVTTNGKFDDTFAQWSFEPVADGCVIRSDVGTYLGRCDHCWADTMYDQFVFNYVSPGDAKIVSYSRWKVEKYGEKFAFKSDLGTYLARCEDCFQYDGRKSNITFVHATAPVGSALWTIACVEANVVLELECAVSGSCDLKDIPPTGFISLKSMLYKTGD